MVGEKAQIRKKKTKPFLYVDNMVVYIADPKESTQNFLEQRSESSKIAGYEINIWKSIVSLYISNAQCKNEIRKTALFTIV